MKANKKTKLVWTTEEIIHGDFPAPKKYIYLGKQFLDKEATISLIKNSYSGNELCPICEKWFNAWLDDLLERLK